MAIVIQHEPDAGLSAAMAFLVSQNQEQQRQQQRDQEAYQQQMQYAQPTGPSPVDAVQSAFAAIMAGQPAAAPQQGGGSRGPSRRQPSGNRAAAGLRFLENQNQLAAQFAQQQNQFANQDAIAQRQAADNAAEAERQMVNAAAINERQQQYAEMQANLQQRNKLMQTAPGMIDPQELAAAQGRINANSETLTGPARAARQALLEGIAQGDPESIRAGLDQGLLAFSPEQLTRIGQIREAMAQVDLDQSLSPHQRSIASRGLAEKLSSIRPMEVPTNEVPLTPIEQYQKDTMTFPHPTLGIPITKQRVSRAGGETWELTDESKEDVKAEHTRRQKLWEKENGIGEADPRIKQAEFEFKQKEQAMKLYSQALNNKMVAQQQLEDLQLKILTAKADLAKAAATEDGGIDDAKAQAALDEFSARAAKFQADVDRFDAMVPDFSMFNSGAALPGMAPPAAPNAEQQTQAAGMPQLPPQAAPPAQQPAPSTQQPPPGTIVFDPVENGLPPIDGPDAMRSLITGRRVYLGDWVMTPKGPREITMDVLQKLGIVEHQ